MQDLNALDLPALFAALTGDGALARLLELARDEDLGLAGDVTTACMIDREYEVRAAGVSREPGVVSGLAAVPCVLKVFGSGARVEALAADGERCEAGQTLWRLHGDIGPILGAERTMLNLVGRLSGVATLTRRFVERVGGTRAVICDTRKTTPGLRALEKYAVRCGGGTLHRTALHDAVLLKDNHLALLGPGDLAPAVSRAAAAARARFDLRFVEVEADGLDQLQRLLDGAAPAIDIVLLDNMAPPQLRKAVALRDRLAPGVLLEASGGIGLDVVREIAETGVDRISVGALTHGATWLDVGLDVT